MKKEECQHRFNAKNLRMIYKYRILMSRALKKDDKTINAAIKHIRDYELFTDFANFEIFNEERADRYIRDMNELGLSLSYMNNSIRDLREFLQWLSHQKGYRSKLNFNHTLYLNLTSNQRRTAKAGSYLKSYCFKQIIDSIRKMPSGTLTEQRNKAMVSMQAMCGLRISELKTVRLCTLIEEEGIYFLDINPKDLNVKFAKTRQANFMPMPDDIMQNVLSWRDTLIERGFKKQDAFFPRISSKFSQGDLLIKTITHTPIKSDSAISSIFKKTFEAAGYDYFPPQRFRKTIARYAAKQSPEFLNAVRQSLGHSSIDTTLHSYGTLSDYEQRNRIADGEFSYK